MLGSVIRNVFHRFPVDIIFAVERRRGFCYGPTIRKIVVFAGQIDERKRQQSIFDVVRAKVIPARLAVPTVLIDLATNMASKALRSDPVYSREVSPFKVPADHWRAI